MVGDVLDASAILRLLDGEAGSDRVTAIIHQQRSGTAYAVVSAIHWGEIVGIFSKRHGIVDFKPAEFLISIEFLPSKRGSSH